MVFDRITLINAYNALKTYQDNNGVIRNILFNRTTRYGTKTAPRFKDLMALKSFINEKYPFIISNQALCLTKDESIWTLLAFEVYSRPEDLDKNIVQENNRRHVIQLKPISKHATFVNNIRGGYESQKKSNQDSLSINKINKVFQKDKELEILFRDYICTPYIENTLNFIEGPAYIESKKNESYNKLIEIHYKETKTKEFPTRTTLFT